MQTFQIQRKITKIFVVFVIFTVFIFNTECLLRKGNNIVKFKKGDTNGGYGLNYSPPNYKNVIVWLHGLCGSAMDWERFVLLVNKKGFLPNTKWILPTSKFRQITAVYGNKCPAWFDIVSFSPTENIEDIDGILESAKRIRDIIKSEIESGIEQSRIFLIGFSQGSAMALITSMIMRDITLGGVIGVSGWIPMIDHLSLGLDSPLNNEIFDFNISDEKKHKTKVFIFHGSKDKVIPFNVFLQTSVFMSIELGIENINQRIYYDIGHTITAMQGVHMMYEISNILNPDNIHEELVTIKHSTLSNNSYSMVLKISDPRDNCICYKFMPCNPNKDGNLSCSNPNCNCTNKLSFYDQTKFFDNLNNKDFGQFNNPYTILQGVPSEKKLKSNNNSSNRNKGKETEQTDSDLITQDLDQENNNDLFLNISGYNNRKVNNQVTNESNQNVDCNNIDNNDDSSDLELSLNNSTESEVPKKHISSLRDCDSFDDIMSHRYLASMDNGSNENFAGSSNIIDHNNKLYTSMEGGIDEINDIYDEEEEENMDEIKENENREGDNTNSSSSITTTTTTTTTTSTASINLDSSSNTASIYSPIYITKTPINDSDTTNKVFSKKISHYNKAPNVIKHYYISDNDDNQEERANIGKDIFDIQQYIDFLCNQSTNYTNSNSETMMCGDNIED
ncbi:carboxylesterase [Cryptosporidium ubiquitum]|uniref:Carboxylesterase n=1 Tax=Cryptosporidium ubiquitum TaxID=857276 RepID=A0A1J4MKI0_9CRYT|nr:carboxylesterase [Cryptosporidium ubiquitum]OII74770.1 carboxylesterase [Cryptosporidium ubiquitum]